MFKNSNIFQHLKYGLNKVYPIYGIKIFKFRRFTFQIIIKRAEKSLCDRYIWKNTNNKKKIYI